MIGRERGNKYYNGYSKQNLIENQQRREGENTLLLSF